jgi:hypothetical protein
MASCSNTDAFMVAIKEAGAEFGICRSREHYNAICSLNRKDNRRGDVAAIESTIINKS